MRPSHFPSALRSESNLGYICGVTGSSYRSTANSQALSASYTFYESQNSKGFVKWVIVDVWDKTGTGPFDPVDVGCIINYCQAAKVQPESPTDLSQGERTPLRVCSFNGRVLDADECLTSRFLSAARIAAAATARMIKVILRLRRRS
jgi:hypothetical protein